MNYVPRGKAERIAHRQATGEEVEIHEGQEGRGGGGWETAVSTRLLATHCVFCARPLRDPASIERGYGPECAEKRGLMTDAPESLDPEMAEQAMKMAPEPLRSAWERVGGKADDPDAEWRDNSEIRRQMLSLGLHYGALAVSFGPTEVSVVVGKVDSAKLCIAAVQRFAQASGYYAAAEQMREKYIEKLEGNLIIFRRSKREGYLGVHTPFSDQWRSWCNANGKYFVHKEYIGKLFFRYFEEKKLGFIANALSGIFGDTLIVDPDGNMVALPTMHIEPEEKIAPAAPTPPVAQMPATGQVESYAVPDRIKLGDKFTTPDGRDLVVQYIDPKRAFIGVGAGSRGKYEFFSFDQVKTISGKEVAADLYEKASRLADQVKEPAPPPLPARATKRALPEGLMEHQVTGVQFIDEHHGRALIADEMGLGKTATSIVAIDAPAVVVPPALLKVNWLRELARWRPDLSVSIISGTEPPSEAQRRADVIIVNYDILDSHVDWLRTRKNETIIADEAHYLKNLEVRFDKDTGMYVVPMKMQKGAELIGVSMLPARDYGPSLATLAMGEDSSASLVWKDPTKREKPERAAVYKVFVDKQNRDTPVYVAGIKKEKSGTFRPGMVVQLKIDDEVFDFKVVGEMRTESLPAKAVPKVRRAAAFYELQRDVPRLVLLTGTPILNRVKEVFPLIHMVAPHEWKSGFDFCVRYCGGHYEQMGPRQIFVCDGRTNSEELHQKINNSIMLRRTADVLNLPEKRRGSMTVSLDEKSAKRYERQVREFLQWVEDNGGPAAVMRARRAEALVKMNRLRETAAEGKVAALVDWIEAHWTSTARPLVVMGMHRSAFDAAIAGVEALNERHREQVAAGDTPDMQAPIRYGTVLGGASERERQAAIDAFQGAGGVQPSLDLVFYSIALATGTTLTRSQDMVFFERAWRPGDLAQAEARIYRKGQKNQCMITYLDAEGTIDAKIAMLLQNKIEAASAVIEGVNLDEKQAAELVFGELFNLGGVTKNSSADTIDQIADSWFSPLPV